MGLAVENALELSGVCKKYRDFQLDNVSFSLPSGCIMGFIGENGAGKTTTMKAILGLIHLDGGSVRILGQDLQTSGAASREEVGAVFDDLPVRQTFSAKTMGSILRNVYAVWDSALYESCLRRFALPEKKQIREYSRGMRMKLGMAMALAHHPRLLLLDEATSGLDPVVRSEILDLLLEFIQEEDHSVLFSSHITSDLERAADYITLIHQGRILFSEGKDSLLERHGLIKCTHGQLAELAAEETLLGIRENAFGCEALTGDRQGLLRRHPELTVDPATLEDLMVFRQGRTHEMKESGD